MIVACTSEAAAGELDNTLAESNCPGTATTAWFSNEMLPAFCADWLVVVLVVLMVPAAACGALAELPQPTNPRAAKMAACLTPIARRVGGWGFGTKSSVRYRLN
jgi:hypothetical protein